MKKFLGILILLIGIFIFPEYIKADTTKTYTCPSDYTLSGTKCTKKFAAEWDDTGAMWSCPFRNTVVNSQDGFCTETIDATEISSSENAPANQSTVSYTCPTGYTLSGTKCTKRFAAEWDDTGAMWSCPFRNNVINSQDGFCTETIDATKKEKIVTSPSTPSSNSGTSTNDSSYEDKEGYIGSNFCGEESVIKALKLAGYFILIAKVAIPLLIVGMGVKDLYKGINSGKDDDVKAGAKQILVRLAIGIFVFFIPNIVGALLGSLLSSEYTNCSNCLFYPTNNCEVPARIEATNPTSPAGTNTINSSEKKSCNVRAVNDCNGNTDPSGAACKVINNACVAVKECSTYSQNVCNNSYDTYGNKCHVGNNGQCTK